jgi:transcriptional regulator with PAS, ATPase and Fis domain
MADPSRWPALLQRADDAAFVLDPRRRLRFVNDAFAAVTGLSPSEARGLSCRRSRPAGPDAPLEDHVAHLLTPPAAALAGDVCRVRRLLRGAAGPVWCDVEFLPLRRQEGVLITGRLRAVGGPETAAPLPERLVAMRQRRAAEFTPALLGDVPRLLHQVRLAASVRSPVWLVGPRGSGKQTAARLIHHLSADREKPFAALDCGRLSARMVLRVVLEERGPGAVYLAHPERLPDDARTRLARWLEPAVAGTVPEAELSLRPRVLAGGERDALTGPLRDTLGVLEIAVPPLRDRRDDLPALAEYVLARLNDDGGPATTGLMPAAWEALRAHDWPGNLTEFVAVIRDARRHAAGPTIDRDHLPLALRLAEAMAPPPPARPIDLDATLAQAERRLIELALRRSRGNRSRAADLLGVNRQRLLRRMEALGLGGEEDAG